LVCGGIQDRRFRRGDYAYCRCSRCGLLASSPIPTAQQISAHYQAKFVSGNYETARRYEAEYCRVHRQIAKFVGAEPGQRVLDVGCFTGGLIEVMASLGVDVCGLELQPEAVAIADKRLPGRVHQADVFGKEFPPGPYDIVTMMGLIEHVLDPMAFLSRAYALLQPGGRLFLQTPDAGSMVARLMGSRWPPLAPIEHIHLFSRQALRQSLQEAGFSSIRFKRHVKLLPVAYVYEMLSSFGPEWRRAMRPIQILLGRVPLPFYAGEMLVSAVKGGSVATP
jgi:2-polyprenyl-3-methyl-5-hydroxy-6-metoxy-1,4-benzoquinol methylase